MGVAQRICGACWSFGKANNWTSQRTREMQAKTDRRDAARAKELVHGRRCSGCGVAQTTKWMRHPETQESMCHTCHRRAVQPTGSPGNVQYLGPPRLERGQAAATIDGGLSADEPMHEALDTVKPQCANCGSTATPKWHKAVVGEGRWCNACRKYYYRCAGDGGAPGPGRVSPRVMTTWHVFPSPQAQRGAPPRAATEHACPARGRHMAAAAAAVRGR